MTDFERLSVLVVESHPGMRTQLRDMLAGMEIHRVQFAVSATVAVRKLRDTRFHVVLCEYHLGDGQDGQHLLEDVRNNDIIPLETVFIMLTGERQYEKVIGAAELIPNDYILKPFAAETLHTRLERALIKRDAFMPVYRAIDAGDLPEAIRLCAESETIHTDYAFDFVRLRADLHMQMGHTDKAQAVFRAALDIRPLPWVRLGLAKTLFMEKRYAEAEQMLLGLIEQNRHYLDAYEWLARTREMGGRLDEARKALLEATTLSPHRLTRLRHVGELSLSVGDPITAERMLSQVVRKSKQSDFREQEDYVHLVRAQLDNGKLEEAANTLDDLVRSMPSGPKTRLCGALAQSHLLIRKGDPEKARQVLSTGLKEYRSVGELSPLLKRELVKTCFENHLETQAQEIVLDILRNAPDEKTIEYTRTMMHEQGRTEMATDLEQRIQAEVRALVTAGARLAQAGDFDGAVREMLTAVRKMPGNTHVLFNASLALLRHIEHHGWSESFATQAKSLIQQARKRDPYNTRFAALTDFLHDLMVRQRQTRRAERKA